jgi:hypothetical protein
MQEPTSTWRHKAPREPRDGAAHPEIRPPARPGRQEGRATLTPSRRQTHLHTQTLQRSDPRGRRQCGRRLRARPPALRGEPVERAGSGPGPAWPTPPSAHGSEEALHVSSGPAGPGPGPGSVGARAGRPADPEVHTELEPVCLPRAVKKLGAGQRARRRGLASGTHRRGTCKRWAMPRVAHRFQVRCVPLASRATTVPAHARSASREWPQGPRPRWRWRGRRVSRRGRRQEPFSSGRRKGPCRTRPGKRAVPYPAGERAVPYPAWPIVPGKLESGGQHGHGHGGSARLACRACTTGSITACRDVTAGRPAG